MSQKSPKCPKCQKTFQIGGYYELLWETGDAQGGVGGVVSKIIKHQNETYTLKDILTVNINSDCMNWDANPEDFCSVKYLGTSKDDFPEYFL